MTKVRQLKFSGQSYDLLGENKKHVNAARFALCLYRQNAVYSYIPKNACSTMRLSLALANGCISRPEQFAWIHNNNATFAAELRDLVSASYTFTILRCPFERLASAFIDKVVRAGTSNQGLSFSGFCKELTKNNFVQRNLHWRPQTELLVYSEYDDIFCVEDMPRAISTVKDKIDLDVVDARGLTGHGLNRFEKVSVEDCAEMKVTELRQLLDEGYSPTTASFYSSECIEITKGLYKGDFQYYSEHLGNSNLMRRFRI